MELQVAVTNWQSVKNGCYLELLLLALLRAGLSNGGCSGRTVEEDCREALMTDFPQEARTSVSHLRHAFARMVVPQYIDRVVMGASFVSGALADIGGGVDRAHCAQLLLGEGCRITRNKEVAMWH